MRPSFTLRLIAIALLSALCCSVSAHAEGWIWDRPVCKPGFICPGTAPAAPSATISPASPAPAASAAPVTAPAAAAPAVPAAGTAAAGADVEAPAPISLATQTGLELGAQISSYRYQEHETADQEFMHETGAKFGVTATATKAFASGFFLTADGRFAYSSNHYSSADSGERGGIPDYLGEIRLLGGKDLPFRRFVLPVYTGIGYRNLYNDLSGSKLSTVHIGTNTITERFYGYGRDSQYLYLPLGVTPRFRVADNARISTNFEYDQLIQGWQMNYFGDINPSYPSIPNRQSSGYGLRGSLMYERASWSVGPFFNYWNIDESDRDNGYSAIQPGYYSFEPHNQTIEYGLQARYRL